MFEIKRQLRGKGVGGGEEGVGAIEHILMNIYPWLDYNILLTNLSDLSASVWTRGSRCEVELNIRPILAPVCVLGRYPG